MRSSFAVIVLFGLCAPWAALAASRPEAEESWIVIALVNWAPMQSRRRWRENTVPAAEAERTPFRPRARGPS